MAYGDMCGGLFTGNVSGGEGEKYGEEEGYEENYFTFTSGQTGAEGYIW